MLKNYSQVGQDLFVLNRFIPNHRGTWVDIGCRLPFEINNTLLLEENGWRGINIDIDDYAAEWMARKTPFVRADALTLDYKALFQQYQMPEVIDYLSLDIEGDGDRYKALQKVMESGYKFNVITIEHDAYRGFNESERMPQRELLTRLGYTLLVPDVYCGGAPFEDWWIK